MIASSVAAFAQSGAAQTGYTPYSIFGWGDIVGPGTAYSTSMAGVGIADRNIRYINVINPAAVNARQAKSFMMDFALENRNTYFRGNAETAASPVAEEKLSSANNTVNMRNIVASFPIYDKAAFKVGIMPYSHVGYDFSSHETEDELVAEAGDILYKKVGEGTVYQSFFGAGVTLFDRLSVGADVNYYFGTIDRYSTVNFNTNSSYSSINTGWNYVVRAFNGKFGLQYTQPFGSASELTVGATYMLGTSVKGDQTRYAFAESGSKVDTVKYETTPMKGYSIPSELGFGISFSSNEKWMVEFDYTMQDWTNVSFEATPGVDFTTAKSSGMRFGFELTPNRYDIRYAFKRWTYRGGIYKENTYMCLNGHQVTREGITLGMSIPVFRYYNGITFTADLGQRGSMKDNLVKERYCIFSIAFNLHDIWFLKSLYN